MNPISNLFDKLERGPKSGALDDLYGELAKLEKDANQLQEQFRSIRDRIQAEQLKTLIGVSDAIAWLDYKELCKRVGTVERVSDDGVIVSAGYESFCVELHSIEIKDQTK